MKVVAHSRPPTDFAVQLASQNGAGKSLTSANVAKLEASKPQDTDEADDKNDIQRHRLEQCNCRLSALVELRDECVPQISHVMNFLFVS